MCERPSIPNALFSSNNTQAAANLLNCTGAGQRECGIVGHGLDGMIATGGGRTPDFTQNLDQEFFIVWEGLFRSLAGRATALKLWGCYVGASQAGADLLFDLATVLNCPVAAPTGEMLCAGGQISFEDGNVWQVATPSQKPSPIPPPHPESDSFLSIRSSDVRFGGSDEAIPVSAINNIRIQRGGASSGVGNARTLDNKQGVEFIRHIDLQNPRDIRGSFFAQQTGTIHVDVDGTTYDLLILANRLVQNAAQPNLHYRTSAQFESFVRGMQTQPAAFNHALAYAWVGATGSCPDPGPYTSGNQLSVGNRNGSRAIVTTIRVTTSRAGGSTYVDRTDTLGPSSYKPIIPCDVDPTTPQYFGLTLLGASWA